LDLNRQDRHTLNRIPRGRAVILGKEGDGTDNGDGDGGCHMWRGGKEVSSNHM